jgi:hypothetical protein
MCDPRYILGLEKLLLGADRGSWKYLPLASAPHTSHKRPPLNIRKTAIALHPPSFAVFFYLSISARNIDRQPFSSFQGVAIVDVRYCMAIMACVFVL